jgi:hypothetical protein
MMSSDPERMDACVMDWEDLRHFADAGFIQTPEPSPMFISGMNRRHQYYHTYVSVPLGHRPGVPVWMIGRLFGVSKATIQRHSKTYLARRPRPRATGRPPILTQAEREDLIEHIRDAYSSSNPWVVHNIVHRITDRCGKTQDTDSIK